jgi:phenylpropionate dioxygenase-like ring-hydroxylating dioxygenase large terminal subunit
MKNLTNLKEIPTSWYTDEAIFLQEQRSILTPDLNYVGHALMVPKINDYHVLPDQSQMIFHHQEGYLIVSNICRHRQAIMLNGRGNTSKIICPVHKWNYDNRGQFLNAPGFTEDVCLNLSARPIQSWRGILMDGKGDPNTIFSALSKAPELDFSDYVYSNTVTYDYQFNWKIFIDVYLDDYHIKSFHPGLRDLVDSNHISWEYADKYSVQKLGINKHFPKSNSINYRYWQEALFDYWKGKLPKHAAVWYLVYPATMIECYPEMVAISTLKPINPHECINQIDFFYPKTIVAEYPELIEFSRLAYMETADEDEEICNRIFKGKRLLTSQGKDDIGPYEAVTEEGIPIFHHYLLKNLY